MRKLSKLFTAILSTALLLNVSQTALAAENSDFSKIPENVEVKVEDNGVMTTAISGSAYHIHNQGTIYVTSPGSSWWAHVKINVDLTSSPVYIACYNPRGELINPRLTPGSDFVAIGGNKTTVLNMANAPAGTYKLVYAVADGSSAKITFSLHDFYG